MTVYVRHSFAPLALSSFGFENSFGLRSFPCVRTGLPPREQEMSRAAALSFAHHVNLTGRALRHVRIRMRRSSFCAPLCACQRGAAAGKI